MQRTRKLPLIALAASLTIVMSAGAQAPGPNNAITDVQGVEVGHYQETTDGALTGTTVVLTTGGAVGGVDVRGSAPGTRETDLLDPINMVQEVHAIVLSGGSAYGLEASTGVMRYLEEQKVGYPVGRDRMVPIVPSAILFDLGRGGDWTRRPTAEFGYNAAVAATTGPVAQGNVGAGTGAFAGGLKGGIGTASIVLENGITVAAIVAVNAAGRPYNPETGELYASWLELGDEFGGLTNPATAGFVGSPEDYFAYFREEGSTVQNTTIGIIATDAVLTKAQAEKIAQMAHDGYARALRPVHTMGDGDAIFAIGTGFIEMEGNDFGAVGAAASDVMARAIVHAILSAESVDSTLSYCDTFEGACGAQ